MKGLKKHIVLFLLMVGICNNALSQSRNNMSLSHDHLILLIDLKSTRLQVDSILKAAGITNVSADMIFKGEHDNLKKDGWKVKKLQNDLLQFDLSLSALKKNPQPAPFVIFNPQKLKDNRPGYPGDVPFGFNNFARVTVHELASGQTRFFVPGNDRAKRIILSGSFNDWSTGRQQMLKTDSGWISDISLQPGVYAYKFIIDGRWTIDMNNRLFQEDGVGNTNSLYFRYNYTFKLPGYPNAKSVNVAGNFNGYNANQIHLFKTFNGWERNLYLKDGIYNYRFMVDGKWVTEGASGNDPRGTSVSLGETVDFKLDGFTKANKVCIAGTFNNWKPDNIFMQKTATGWAFPYTLAAGNYQYKFIVDGKWMTDPANQRKADMDGETNSFICVKPNHTFTLKGYPKARTIRISGTFNDWAEDGYTLAKNGDNWTISLRLKPGKCLYKFIVDGQWVLDNTNKLWEQNEHNTGNSVVWVEN
ncbi:glycogen-binding domain-containing protein [Mucilaginibacter myungsuensis]|uniref:Glycogen-binding domain-containing protein n=1 Tax=Mucilaginibacter myungsuensis TaxID=649104 RepID=A0A929PXZ1_9SPHI|nr:glycogen-binding domain-containing protein [Mucilaginibacter myungsuensis]MBE9663681.1 glycogen-binding domain-containing protein [Mucilaginibacter myungsuensis]MDN3598995.1 glycogen-binding domain-containing protein [Mucilaginibacter myungsuensis]